MVSRVAGVPALPDARRAALAMADAGVAGVVLFGSVARGEATERSDIDLVAIYNDLDYGDRWGKRRYLKLLAESAAGCPVDVSVTDRAEWRVRTTSVQTSFEYRAARDGVVVFDRPACDVDRDKEMVLTAGDYEEAVYRLGLVAGGLGALHGWLQPGSVERIERRLGNDLRAFDLYVERLRRGCGECHKVIEASIKALIHLGADPERLAWGHDIAELCDRLPAPHRSAVPPLLEPHGPDGISPRYGRRYPEATPELLTELTRMACATAAYTVRRFDGSLPAVDTIRAYVGYVEDCLDGYDLATGKRRRL